MSNHKIIFYGEQDSEAKLHTLEVFATNQNKINVIVKNEDGSIAYTKLNKSTAIKLSRVLKAEISKIQS